MIFLVYVPAKLAVAASFDFFSNYIYSIKVSIVSPLFSSDPVMYTTIAGLSTYIHLLVVTYSFPILCYQLPI
jgi:hypothetical protein